MVSAEDVRLYRQILKAQEALKKANTVLKEAQETQKKIAQMEKERTKKISKAHHLATVHHNLYKKLLAQKEGTNDPRKKINIAKIMNTVRKERQHLLRDIKKIQTQQ